MELPVVCTDADGLAENVEDGVTGFVVPRGDPRALADKVEILARDPAHRRRMGASGRRRVLEKFRLEDQIRRFEQFYGEVLAGAPPRRTRNPRETERLPETRDFKLRSRPRTSSHDRGEQARVSIWCGWTARRAPPDRGAR